MPLIDITTNLKSLRYGEFGAEDPLITKDINNPPDSSGLSMEFERRKDDLVRITKLMGTGPGLQHIANQAALNVVEQSIQSFKYKDGEREFGKSNFGRQLGRGLVNTATSLASTLAQVPVNGTGTHFVEGFRGKQGYLPQIQGHVLSRNGGKINIDTSAILDEKGNLIDVSGSIFETSEIGTAGARLSDSLLRYSASVHSNENGTPVPLAYHNHEASGSLTKVKYFEAQLDKKEPLEKAPNSHSSGFQGGKDLINLVTIPSLKLNSNPSNAALESLVNEQLQEKTFKGDLIRFSFTTIVPRNNESDQPSLIPLYFRAYLDSFGDNYAASWNSFKYIGRGEDFYSYEGFNRSVDISFKIAALSDVELDLLIEKLNLLAGTTAPTYTEGSYMRGNFTSVTVGNYLQNQTGVINSVDISWNTDYQWDIEKELPMILDVSVSFTPIHSFAPQYGSGFINKTNTLFKGTSNTQTNEQVQEN